MTRLRGARLSHICCIVVVVVGWVFICASSAPALEKHKMTYKALGKNTKYTVQHILDVRDIPGHRIRIHEIHRTFPADNPLKFEGVAVKENWEHTFSDYINWTGRHWGYNVAIMENGDKIYWKHEGATHTTLLPDGSSKGTFNGSSIITGGTGKFAGIRGTMEYTGIWDPTKGLNEGDWQIEYWME